MSIDKETSGTKSCRRYSGAKSNVKSGRWTQAEKLTFLVGLKKFGRGKWKEIATMIPSRSTIQVKTHAQMVMKRVEEGEDIFDELRVLKTDQSSFADHCHHRRSCSMNSETDLKSPEIVIDRAFDTLTLRDQGAVLILYQMANTM
ncbi:hypothetical protein HJC23_009738 [Cyclotella cryptica]|uniref:Uncharacterized protein n=1 Tax=Cyclotella cryptica TaxID=29204 RepID=A0ABD3PP01_9STRA|eukprot:CCRYP_012881-RA/>CCRYP_012881-RA protein AED:0.32 eAED:0.32 QI:507/1/1/1/1/1/2/362/144